MARNTRHTYTTGVTQWENFCRENQFQPYPAPEYHLFLFVASLSLRSCSYGTAKTYLAGISFAHELRGLRISIKNMSVVQRALQGLRHNSVPSESRLPITIDILQSLHYSLAGSPLSAFSKLSIWACFTVAFFGFFRIGELLPSRSGNHILTTDVSLSVSGLSIHLRKCKTDQSGKGSLVRISPSMSHICAVRAMEAYLPYRLSRFPHGPVFVKDDGHTLTPGLLNHHLKTLLASAGVNAQRYSSHSFRAGAATTAAEMGVPDWLIKALGRWSSEAYQIYITTPHSVISEIPRVLCRNLLHA